MNENPVFAARHVFGTAVRPILPPEGQSRCRDKQHQRATGGQEGGRSASNGGCCEAARLTPDSARHELLPAVPDPAVPGGWVPTSRCAHFTTFSDHDRSGLGEGRPRAVDLPPACSLPRPILGGRTVYIRADSTSLDRRRNRRAERLGLGPGDSKDRADRRDNPA